MDHREWAKGFPGAILVCDRAGIILEMNDRAAQQYADDGGRALLGANVLDCHPEPSRTKLQQLLETGQSNVYTIEKRGVKKLVYQAPWHEEGSLAGMVEVVLELPAAMPHFVRDKVETAAG
jgi:transcriptional regulator with PAS, ATPase and Fis domain